MIETIKIYESYAFNNPFKVVSLLKNCVRQISKNKSFATKSPIFISVRWCKNKNMFVGDNGTGLNRDKSGITLKQINNNSIRLSQEILTLYRKLLNFCNKTKSFYEFCKMHNLIVNKFKCIVFNVDIDKELLLPVGIFSFVKSKSREGIDSIKNNKLSVVNISHEIIRKITSFDINLFNTSHLTSASKKINVENHYNSLIKNNNSDLIYKKFNLKKEKFKDSYYDCEVKNRVKYKHYFFIQDLINKVFKESFESLDILIVYDENLQKFIKLKKVNYNTVEREQKNYESYLPKVL